MDSASELARFKKSFLLHSSRYNLYSEETLIKGSTKTHNQAVKALGKLQDRVMTNPSFYADLLLELLQDNDPKISLSASFICLVANVHTQKAIDTLAYIANNIPDISMICDFDIRGSITRFKKKQMDAKPRNEVDTIAEKMKSSDCGDLYTDAELFDMILRLQNIDMCGHDGRTPLLHACIFNRLTLAERLIEAGANVNKKDCTQKSALHLAVVTGNIEIILLLLKYHANVNEQELRGFTALDFANIANISQDKVNELIELLVSHGAKTKQEILNIHH